MTKKIFFFFLFLMTCSGAWFLLGRPAVDQPIVVQTDEPSVETVGKLEQEESRLPFFSIRGRPSMEILEEIGKPTRTEPSEYGYEWWVYEEENQVVMQLGIQNDEVVTGVLFHPEEGKVKIGDKYKDVKERFSLQESYRLESEGAYTLELTEKDLKERPVISLSDRWSAQLYIDNVTEKVFAIRMVRNDILLKHQPYKIIYRGSLPQQESLTSTQWEEVQSGMEAQIFSITNNLRVQNGLDALTSHEGAREVAFSHSRDMDEHNYFSHYSQNGDGLKERLGELSYIRAGENIASQYVDATAAVHGWLNSPGHRKALLDPDYTHLGVGVHQRYYTQNFLTVP
ncbi:Uncharacterized conserved protein YkwD, contains CAP (CSP/antigen 5/PR1) domain [Halobacillus dabanensis]|uniref:Uncharacterized conserved protein YkwD, contains CAP (CSP/antigen 5/PR1) domain n=1 Tax=Halobacillus dabanensis TaxID=240302 RepID=A0A1I3VBY2_HALDA|nr:CAP domain-containing protein [Halobacillus dabanensis]SFJ92519.1 Uncharacterized conserved protein YkwD, contains CAP (CSP/antigen 5/PR1) domain [Halobacillus dabanensis]